MPDTLPPWMTARELAGAIRARRVSPLEALEGCLARIDAHNGAVNAVIWRNDDEARAAAKSAGDELLRRDPSDLPPFFGVPIPIKDLTAVAGWPVTHGSSAVSEAPSTDSELVVEALRRAGFVLAGRTNTPEFGPITAAENNRYGITRNPWDLNRTPGGSSGGAAAAVALGMYTVAHANDGGGSIRIPASCCGLVGLKVSRGRVPRLVQGWEGGSVEGVVARDVADSAAILDVTRGPERGQWYNAPAPDRPFASEVGVEPGRLRIGLFDDPPLRLPMDPACGEAARRAAAALEGLGHHVEKAAFIDLDEYLPPFLNVVNSGLGSYDADWDKVEPHIRANRAAAQQVDSLTYTRSVRELQLWSRRVVARFGTEFDLLLTPTMSIEPPKAGEVLAAVHGATTGGPPPLQVFQMAVLTSPWNMSGLPAISLPTHMGTGGIPVGVQLVAGPWAEALLLRVAAQLEAALPWSDRHPAGF